jgi:translation initiation factor 3 subunit C
MSSFFAKLGSSGSDTDESGSESEESILSGDEGQVQDLKLAQKKGKFDASMFEKGVGSEESDDDLDSDEEQDDDEEDLSDDSAADRQVIKVAAWRM